MSYIPTIDVNACAAHGDCVDVAPEVFALEDTAVVIGDGPDDLIMQAAEICPSIAITVVDSETATGLPVGTRSLRATTDADRGSRPRNVRGPPVVKASLTKHDRHAMEFSKERDMADQQVPQDQELQEAQTRISHRISGFFLGLIGIMSLVAAIAYLALPGNDQAQPLGRSGCRPDRHRCDARPGLPLVPAGPELHEVDVRNETGQPPRTATRRRSRSTARAEVQKDPMGWGQVSLDPGRLHDHDGRPGARRRQHPPSPGRLSRPGPRSADRYRRYANDCGRCSSCYSRRPARPWRRASAHPGVHARSAGHGSASGALGPCWWCDGGRVGGWPSEAGPRSRAGTGCSRRVRGRRRIPAGEQAFPGLA